MLKITSGAVGPKIRYIGVNTKLRVPAPHNAFTRKLPVIQGDKADNIGEILPRVQCTYPLCGSHIITLYYRSCIY